MSELPSDKIYELRDFANKEEQQWLRSRGWSYTCRTLGSLWLWSREWDGKTFLVDQITAAYIQAKWDQDAFVRAHPAYTPVLESQMTVPPSAGAEEERPTDAAPASERPGPGHRA